MIKDFIYYNVNIQVRVPVNDDGSLGSPETYKKFVTQIKDTKSNYIKNNDNKYKKFNKDKQAKIAVDKLKTNIGEVEYDE
jgi:hypothetical protein